MLLRILVLQGIGRVISVVWLFVMYVYDMIRYIYLSQFGLHPMAAVGILVQK